MPANTKWPDFQLASKLRHFMGSQSSVPEGVPANESLSSPSSSTAAAAALFGGGAHSQQRDPQHYIDDSQEPAFNGQSVAMPGPDQQQIDVDEDLDSLSHDEGGVDLDATDYGDLEMFDSNASQVFYPDPADMTKPEVQPAPDASVVSPPKREKRKKKDKSTKSKASAPAPEDEEEVVVQASAELAEPASPEKKRKRAKKKSLRDSELIDSQLNEVEETMPAQPQPGAAGAGVGEGEGEGEEEGPVSGLQQSHEPPAAASSQLTRKRGPADSAEGKQRKKRRSKAAHAGEEVIPGTQEDDLSVKPDPAPAHATFLRSHRTMAADAPLGSIEEGAERDPNESQLSPSAARARRRSQSIGLPHSRETSVPFRAAVAPMAPMAIDVASRTRDVDSMDLESADEHAAGGKADADVEDLAREAWREHVNTQQDGKDGEDGSGQGASKRRNTRGKKAKATASDVPAQAGSSAAADPVIDPNLSAKTPPQRKTRGSKIAVKSFKGKPPAQDKKQSGARVEANGDGDEEGGEAEAEAVTRTPGDPAQYKANGFLQGRFSDDELAKITQAVESFRVESGLTQYEINEMIHAPGGTAAGSSHAELWLRLTSQCPDRKRQKVINVTRKKFHNFVARGTWTSEQDTELAELAKVHATSWSKIAAIINRHPEDVRDRYRNYIVCGASQRKDVWNKEEESRLRAHVKQAMESIDELRNDPADPAEKDLLSKKYEELIDWQAISEQMGRTRSRLQCITKWKLLIKRSKKDAVKASLRFGIKEDRAQRRMAKLDAAREQLATMEEPEQYRLVLAIHKAGPESDDKIPWDKLVDKPFRTKWSRGCQLLLWDRLKRSVPEWDKKTMREITQYIINLYNHTGRMPEAAQSPDDERELEIFLKQTRAREESSAQQPKSAEVIEDSGAEDEVLGKADEAPQGQTDDLDLNIDPALSTQVPPSAQGRLLAPKPAVKNKQEKQAEAEKAPSKRRSKKGTTAVEVSSSSKDAEEAAAAAAAAAQLGGVPVVEAEVEAAAEEPSAKDTTRAGKRGGGKNKSPAKAKAPRTRGKDAKTAVAAVPEIVSDSDMEDVEDLPARVPSSATRARK